MFAATFSILPETTQKKKERDLIDHNWIQFYREREKEQNRKVQQDYNKDDRKKQQINKEKKLKTSEKQSWIFENYDSF